VLKGGDLKKDTTLLNVNDRAEAGRSLRVSHCDHQGERSKSLQQLLRRYSLIMLIERVLRLCAGLFTDSLHFFSCRNVARPLAYCAIRLAYSLEKPFFLFAALFSYLARNRSRSSNATRCDQSVSTALRPPDRSASPLNPRQIVWPTQRPTQKHQHFGRCIKAKLRQRARAHACCVAKDGFAAF